MNPEV